MDDNVDRMKVEETEAEVLQERSGSRFVKRPGRIGY